MMTSPTDSARDRWELTHHDDTWDPYSRFEDFWHSCPGHEWERILWETGAYGKPELITRCPLCGAPRCDAIWRTKGLTDHEQQLYRCTMERHHPVGSDLGANEGHDYLVEPPT